MPSERDRIDAAPLPVVVAITGASGAMFSVRLLQVLCYHTAPLHLMISQSGAAVIQQELGLQVDLARPDLSALVGYVPVWTTSDDRRAHARGAAELADQRLQYHRHDDYMAPVASGSYRTAAMVVCPCSGSTLSGIARAASANLIQRAADVHLKEKRTLVVVPRETPLSLPQLENMQRLAAAGAVVLPAMPGWYHGVESPDCLIDFVVARILDQLGLDNELMSRWGSQ